MNFANKLIVLRKQLGLSQEALAQRLGISRQSIAKWEASLSYPAIEHLIALSSVFNVTIDYLVKQQECNRGLYATVDNYDLLLRFRLEASSKTYAGYGTPCESVRVGSIDYMYERDNLVYIDSYFGSEQFSGQEIIYQDGNVVYSMSYTGRVIDNRFDGDFLKRALLEANMQTPYRGPSYFEQHNYVYTSSVSTDHSWFQGYEKICFEDELVYEAYFYGGVIK